MASKAVRRATTTDFNRAQITVASKVDLTITTAFSPVVAEEISMAFKAVPQEVSTGFNLDRSKAVAEVSMASKVAPIVIAGIHRSIQTMVETTIFRAAALPTVF